EHGRRRPYERYTTYGPRHRPSEWGPSWPRCSPAIHVLVCFPTIKDVDARRPPGMTIRVQRARPQGTLISRRDLDHDHRLAGDPAQNLLFSSSNGPTPYPWAGSGAGAPATLPLGWAKLRSGCRRYGRTHRDPDGRAGDCGETAPGLALAKHQASPRIIPEGAMNYWLRMVLAAGSVAVLPASAWAQSSGPRASPGLQQPQLRDDEQIMPSQIVRPPPAPPAKPKVAAKPKPGPAAADTDTGDNPPAPAVP